MATWSFWGALTSRSRCGGFALSWGRGARGGGGGGGAAGGGAAGGEAPGGLCGGGGGGARGLAGVSRGEAAPLHGAFCLCSAGGLTADPQWQGGPQGSARPRVGGSGRD